MAIGILGVAAALAALQGTPPPLGVAPGEPPPMARAGADGGATADMGERLAAAHRYLMAIRFSQIWRQAVNLAYKAVTAAESGDAALNEAAPGVRRVVWRTLLANEPRVEARVAHELAVSLSLSELEERIAEARPNQSDRIVAQAVNDAREEMSETVLVEVQRSYCRHDNSCPPDLIPR